jgi:hypothetical protein
VVTVRCVITHRLEGSRFGPCLKPIVFSLGACLSENVIKQAAPANVSTQDRWYRRAGRMKNLRPTRCNKRSRAVIRGSRLLNNLFGLFRTRKNIAKSSGTIQSGLPDVASQSLNDGAKSGSPSRAVGTNRSYLRGRSCRPLR